MRSTLRSAGPGANHPGRVIHFLASVAGITRDHYDAGLGLELRKLTGHPRRVVWRLIALGVPITIALATCMALVLLGMPEQAAALMTGAIHRR